MCRMFYYGMVCIVTRLIYCTTGHSDHSLDYMIHLQQVNDTFLGHISTHHRRTKYVNTCLAISHWLLNVELGIGHVTSRGLDNLHHGLELLVGSRGVEEDILFGQRPAEYVPGHLDSIQRMALAPAHLDHFLAYRPCQ